MKNISNDKFGDSRADDLALIERVEAWLRDKPELRDSNLRRLCALARAGLDARPREPDVKMIERGGDAYEKVKHAEISWIADAGSRPIKYDVGHIWRAMWDAWARGRGEDEQIHRMGR